MNIRFNKVEIENFRSIDNATVELSNQGTVVVKGINEYEEKATSNGSGKSSMFEAITFALFEETSSGEKDVANRINNCGFTVNLYFSIDENEYLVTRFSKGGKSSVVFYKNDVDISARNKTDTNKLIIETIGITKDIFLDSVFLSQNISTNLASLSPTARKERLEVLTSTEYVISNFKDKMKVKQTEYEAEIVKLQLEKNKLLGKQDSIIEQRNSVQKSIDNIDEQIARRNALGNLEQIEASIKLYEADIKELSAKINSFDLDILNQDDIINGFRQTGDVNQAKKDELNAEISKQREVCNNIMNDMATVKLNNSTCDKEISRLNIEIDKIRNSDTCPTCGRKYDNFNEEHLKKSIEELENLIQLECNKKAENDKIYSEYNGKLELEVEKGKNLKKQLESLELDINKFKTELGNLELIKTQFVWDKQNINKEIENKQQAVEELKSVREQIISIEIGNKEEFLKILYKLDEDYRYINESIIKIDEDLRKFNDYSGTVKHILQLITKEFRTYLLQNSLVYLNKLLDIYSRKLFSNSKDIITINGDDTKLDIRLGNATYESLSGGEKTRVNIALLLAQKSLANTIGNVSFNIIILDEILGYCDSQAESNVINLVAEELEDLESIYMVSHKEIPIGYDTQLTVIKNKDGLSRIRNY